MKNLELFTFAAAALCGMAGMFAVLIFDWQPDPKYVAAAAFNALMFAANARYWQARRHHIEPR